MIASQAIKILLIIPQLPINYRLFSKKTLHLLRIEKVSMKTIQDLVFVIYLE